MCTTVRLFVAILVAVLAVGDLAQAKVRHKVRCSDDEMVVEVIAPEDAGDVYLEQLQHYPDPACRGVRDGTRVTFTLSLRDIFQCGVTRVANQASGRRVFYHRVVVEAGSGAGSGAAKEVLLVKCVLTDAVVPSHVVAKRNVLPAGFQEPEFVEITTNLTEKAPEPVLAVGVRQGGTLVTGELNVNPGTPLQMEIFLDKGSAPIYGLLVSYMQVTDTKQQEETIIFNGCSVDPYLFENFNTVDGDFLAAKFRAFKFPESTYVQFKGTVNVCLDKCRGVECSNGKTGYGRRRRAISTVPADPNKVFEVTMTTFLKVDYLEDKPMLEKGLRSVGNDSSARDSQPSQNLKLATETVGDELQYKVYVPAESAAPAPFMAWPTLALALALTLALRG